MVDPDSHFALACRKGDRAALELLFRRYVDRVWRYAWFVTRSRDAAGEIVQDTFLRVLKSIGGFQGKSTFATWLFTVTRSATAEWMRRERQPERAERRRSCESNIGRGGSPFSRAPRFEQERALRGGRVLRLVQPDGGEIDVSDTAAPEAHGLGDEGSRQAVRDAIGELPPAQRDALILCEMVGMSIAEAAEALGWGQSRVKVTVFRARRKLRELLRPLVGDEHREHANGERAGQKG